MPFHRYGPFSSGLQTTSAFLETLWKTKNIVRNSLGTPTAEGLSLKPYLLVPSQLEYGHAINEEVQYLLAAEGFLPFPRYPEPTKAEINLFTTCARGERSRKPQEMFGSMPPGCRHRRRQHVAR